MLVFLSIVIDVKSSILRLTNRLVFSLLRYNITMSEIRRDLGYRDEMPSEESQREMRRILAGQPPKDPEPDWKLDEKTKTVGHNGIAEARRVLAEAQQARINKHGIEDSRAVLDAKRRQSTGEALTPEDERILAKLHRQDYNKYS